MGELMILQQQLCGLSVLFTVGVLYLGYIASLYNGSIAPKNYVGVYA